jgi:energy-coupling factor transport system ATP-binding protein
MILETKQVSFQYPQNGTGLPPTSLQFYPEEMVLVSGASGSGKSTLARCLSGLIPHLYHGKMDGEVLLDGHPTTAFPLWKLSNEIGLVFQNPATQMLTPSVEDEILFGLENLGLARPTMKKRLEETLREFGLTELRNRSPQTLSGGEQQKVALASIMARKPPVIIFDEPLSMLDPNATLEFLEQIQKLKQTGRTAILFEHRKETLASLDGIRPVHLPGRKLAPQDIPDFEWPQTQSEFTVSIRDLSLAYGTQQVLSRVNFSARSGERIAIVGKNGVGKTTLLRALVGFHPYTGQITISPSGSSPQPDFGIVYQNPDLQLFNPTVREEILYRLENPDPAYYEWLIRALGLSEYETWPPLLLSEGEKKRAALATVLMRKPQHGVLLDEPSLGQDTAHKKMLLRILGALSKAGKLILITTHDVQLAAHMDRVIFLSEEGIAADGPPAEVLYQPANWTRAGMRYPDWLTQGGGGWT